MALPETRGHSQSYVLLFAKTFPTTREDTVVTAELSEGTGARPEDAAESLDWDELYPWIFVRSQLDSSHPAAAPKASSDSGTSHSSSWLSLLSLPRAPGDGPSLPPLADSWLRVWSHSSHHRLVAPVLATVQPPGAAAWR